MRKKEIFAVSKRGMVSAKSRAFQKVANDFRGEMPNKKKKTGGFYYYMLEVREDIEATEGYRPNMIQLQQLAGPGWSAMSPEEREPYNRMAKDQKRVDQMDPETKFNSLGVAFSTLDAEEREKEEEDCTMKITIKKIVNVPSPEALREVRFYVSHVNWYYKQYKDQEYWYCPCEISIIEFSLLDGITNKFHKILHQGELPLGVRADAKEQADKYHDIQIHSRPDKPAPEKEENMSNVFAELVEFLRPGAETAGDREVLPPIFTMGDSVNHNWSSTAVKNALHKFSGASHERRDLFRVFPLPQLFFALKLKYDQGYLPEHGLAILEREIENDHFAASTDLECEYHRESENYQWCSQSVALRWVYTVMDHICHKAGIKLIPGKHRPQGAVAHVSSNQADTWRTQGGAGGPDADKFKDLTLHWSRETKEELKMAAQKVPLPQNRGWGTASVVSQSDDGWTSVAPRNPRGWNTVASAGSSDTSDFPAMSSFPQLGGAHRGMPRPRSDASSGGVNMRPTSMNLPTGRGKIFER